MEPTSINLLEQLNTPGEFNFSELEGSELEIASKSPHPKLKKEQSKSSKTRRINSIPEVVTTLRERVEAIKIKNKHKETKELQDLINTGDDYKQVLVESPALKANTKKHLQKKSEIF